MQSFLRQSSASQSRMVGPFVDDTDFKTPETGLTIANTDVKLCKNGAASVNKNSGGGTHRANGRYSLTFNASDTDTVGELDVSITVAGALTVNAKFTVLEEAIYDALFAASADGFDASKRVNVGRWLGNAVTSGSGNRPAVDAVAIGGSTGAADQVVANIGELGPSNVPADLDTVLVRLTSGRADNLDNLDEAISTRAIPGDQMALIDGAITAAKIAAAAFTAGKFASGAFDAVWSVATRTLSAFGFDVALSSAAQAAVVAAIEAEIADDATGEAVKQAIIDKLIENLPDLDDLSLAAIASAVRTELATELGRLDVAVGTRSSHTANAVRDAILDRVLASNHEVAGSPGKLLQAVTEARLAELDAANLPANIDTLLTRVDVVVSTRSSHDAAAVWAVGTRTLTALGFTLAAGDFAAGSLDGKGDWLLASNYVAPNNSGIAAIKVVSDKHDTLLVADGGVWQYTANALELAPAGGGGGGSSPWSESEKDEALADLDTIKAKTQLITPGSIKATSATHVSEVGGELTLTQGESYTAAANNKVTMLLEDSRLPATVLTDGTKVKLKIKARSSGQKFTYVGAIDAFASNVATCTFEIPRKDTVNLQPGRGGYAYEVDFEIGGDVDQVLTSATDSPVTVRNNID